ncbi:DNA polymerase zeta catalytic subunit-like [Terrapene carolina triunguis]|uniref:DNA polymerase zeta catalytic subunit-like n=1 Tax=Terrapene triunguis TaxID=2587831 RepID=UPI000E77B09B|nr:DNA polymerase zeta catalytic subunit-like [Terrapene carolina triunguis]
MQAEEVSEETDPMVDILVPEGPSSVALPLIKTIQNTTKVLWQTLTSLPPLPPVKGVEQKYFVPSRGYENLFTHPQLGVLVVEAANQKERQEQSGPIPKSKEVKKLDLFGQKTCLHLHGIFPYLYVPYDGYGKQSEHYLRQVAFSIDRALNVALGNPSSTVQHVFKVSLVSGMPFYGYHEKEREFMKIYLYNPSMVKRVCELLQGGAIMNKFYQPHEAHIPYLLQLFIDYNLYGMNLINLAAVKFRKAKRRSDTLGGIGCYKDHLPENSITGTFFRWEEDEIPRSACLNNFF